MSIVEQVGTPVGGRTPLRVAVGLGAACIGLAVWNPGDHGVALCPTKAVTGLDCPFCGGLRAVASLGRGDVVRAMDHNLLVVLAVPLAVVWWVVWWRADRRGEPAPRLRLPRAAWVAIVGVLAVFTVVRNLPVGGVPHWLNSATS
jgi:hypothetical protein